MKVPSRYTECTSSVPPVYLQDTLGIAMWKTLYLLPVPIYLFACILFGGLSLFYSSLTFAFGLVFLSVVGFFLIDGCLTKSGVLKPKEEEPDEPVEAIEDTALESYTT